MHSRLPVGNFVSKLVQNSKMNIAIIEKNELYRESLKTVLNQIDDFNVVCDCDNFDPLFHLKNKIELVLIDYNVIEGKRSQNIQQIIKIFSDIKIIVITDYGEISNFDDLRNKSVTDVIYKSANKKVFETIIRCAFSNNAVHEISKLENLNMETTSWRNIH